MTTAAIIVAAGRGTRAGGTLPKQYQPLRGMPILGHTLRALTSHPQITQLVVVIHPDDRVLFDGLTRPPTPLRVVNGGDSRDGVGAGRVGGRSRIMPNCPDS